MRRHTCIRRIVRTSSILLLTTVLTAGCSVIDPLIGRFPGARGRIVLIIEPGFSSTDRLLALSEPLVREAARSGAVIDIWLLRSGVVGKRSRVNLAGTSAGDFFPSGRNQAAWDREFAANTAAALTAIGQAIDESEPDGTGAALFDALAWGAGRVHELDGEGAMEVVLITGGGVHATSTLDLADVDFAMTSPASAIAAITPINDPDVAVQIVGAGAFPDVWPTPDGTWADGVRASFEAWCTGSRTRSCTVTDSVLTNREAP